jgi:hypothetical protein
VSPTERNLQRLIAGGYWVVLGRGHQNLLGFYQAAAFSPAGERIVRVGDTITEAVSELARDLRAAA